MLANSYPVPRDHTLQRKVGDWDDAEQDALVAVEHEEMAGAPA